MRNIYFESFANDSSEPEVARNFTSDLRSLVRNNRSWLPKSDYAGANARYNRMPLGRAVAQVVRVGSSELVRASIIREGFDAVGMRTLIMNQTVQHPDLGFVRGTEVDYWLDGDVANDEELHRLVAMVSVADGTVLKPEDTTFATLYPDNRDHQPDGLREELTPYGDPAQLSAPLGDPFGVVKQGDSQLYAAKASISIPTIETT